MMNRFFNFPLPNKAGDHKNLGNVIADSDSLVIAECTERYQGLTVVVTNDTRTARRLQQNLAQFGVQAQFFPDWETLPYDSFSPNQDIISARLSALFYLQNSKKGVLILPISTLMQRLCPPAFLQHNVLLIQKGDRYQRDRFRLQLEKAGYRAVEQVLEHGEFAMRGALLDLFPMGSHHPYRLDFFDDEIDSIRIFDVDTQRTTNEIEKIELLPAHEFPSDDKGIEYFRTRFREYFTEIRRDPEHIYQQVSKGMLSAGIEYWQPLFFDQMATLFDYLPADTLFITYHNMDNAATRFYQDAEQRYQSRRVDPMRPLLPPQTLWLKEHEINHHLKNYPRLKLNQEQLHNRNGQSNLAVTPLPKLTIQAQHKEPLQQLRQFIEDPNSPHQIIFSVETQGRRETLLDLLTPLKIKPVQIQQLSQAQLHTFSLMIGNLEHGFILNQQENAPATAIICESDLLGERVQQRQRQEKQINPDALIRNLAELKIGQPVVHLDHGVGRYHGLTTLETGGMVAEYLVLEYADQAKLYVPVTALHLISRYVGGNEETAPIHKLGSDQWSKTRQKAAEKIRDVAAELLDVYARREAREGFAFKYDKNEFRQFSATFPFEETFDQQMAINAVISDMCQARPMDRLVCGDVGFGKTEVAMRAAFLAVMNHKQVAVLVPTTLLAQQHYDNFQDRFANLPVNIAMLSRFKTAKEQKNVLEQVSEGKVDILIGTHKLLQNDVNFYDLGLLIIDEEHRFGVRQKEKIKQLRADIDILTLTATPIPRTLNMAMNGIRDLSIIATPPARRLSIKTFVRQGDDLTIREAILREILRGGQVYYLHNDVATIENCAEKLATLIPEARITIGHGQMRERELERVMSDFYHQRYNLLVCTTIIETGIDVPSANTIIIDRADRFGLAQLHQLRGRVGRSHHQAYAYLLTPPTKLLSKDAQKRLEALSSLDNLGAGFVLATHDLEIRGAGELLGSEQSGQIESIGFSLYMELLENAMDALKAGKEPSLDELMQNQVDIDLRIPALLPDDYLGDVNLRLSFYKRIAGAEDFSSLEAIKIELIDRFGTPPTPVKNLLQLAKMRLTAKPLGIQKIEASANGGYLEFSPNADIDPLKFLQLIQNDPQTYRFEGAIKFRFNQKFDTYQERLEFVETLINNLVN